MKMTLPAKVLGVLLFVHYVVVAESTSFCKAPSQPGYGIHDGGWRTIFSIGSSVRYSCYTGYTLRGASKLTCVRSSISGAKWNYYTPRCVQKPTCPILKFPSNGELKLGNGHNVGSVANYSCKSGFSLVGNKIRKCQSNRVWSGSYPRCKAIRCNVLPKIENGHVVLTGTFVGAKATYRCDDGYVLIGFSHRTCYSNGQWSYREPSCCSEFMLVFYLNGTG